MFGMHGRRGGPSVEIAKAENGYMVTLARRGNDDDALMDLGTDFGVPPEPHRLQEAKKERERVRPRVYVYSEIEEAWAAIKEFLLDGRIPKGE